MITYDYSRFIKQIDVTRDEDGTRLYDDYKSMYNCLSQCGETFTGMAFARKVWLAAEILNEIEQSIPHDQLKS
jgi:hypothetical protein